MHTNHNIPVVIDVRRIKNVQGEFVNHTDDDSSALVWVDFDMVSEYGLPINPESGEDLCFTGRVKLTMNDSLEIIVDV